MTRVREMFRTVGRSPGWTQLGPYLHGNAPKRGPNQEASGKKAIWNCKLIEKLWRTISQSHIRSLSTVPCQATVQCATNLWTRSRFPMRKAILIFWLWSSANQWTLRVKSPLATIGSTATIHPGDHGWFTLFVCPTVMQLMFSTWDSCLMLFVICCYCVTMWNTWFTLWSCDLHENKKSLYFRSLVSSVHLWAQRVKNQHVAMFQRGCRRMSRTIIHQNFRGHEKRWKTTIHINKSIYCWFFPCALQFNMSICGARDCRCFFRFGNAFPLHSWIPPLFWASCFQGIAVHRSAMASLLWKLSATVSLRCSS